MKIDFPEKENTALDKLYNLCYNLTIHQAERGVYMASVTGVSGNLYGISEKSSQNDIQSVIKRLEGQKERFRKQQENTSSRISDERIKDLDKRIENLENRLSKMRAEGKEDGECETCKNRKYQDESDDPGVSFKSASKIAPGAAEAAVRGHEYEHVNRNQAKAGREGKEVVYQTVRIKHGICPECGASYVAGGETVTVTREKNDDRFDVGLRDESGEIGGLFDEVA